MDERWEPAGTGSDVDCLLRELVVDVTGVGVLDWNLVTGQVASDRRLLELLGAREDAFDGTVRTLARWVHPDDRATLADAVGKALATPGEYRVEYRVVLPDGRTRWIEGRGRALADGEGRAVRVVGVVREAEPRGGDARADLLAEVNKQLGETLDPTETVARFARLMVPALADWCLVTLVDVDGERADWRRGLRDLGWSHADPRREPLVAAYARTRLDAVTDGSPIAQALRGGQPVVVPRDARDRFLAGLAPGEAADLMRELDPESAVIIPLRGRSHPVGLLTLYNGAERPALDRHDLDTVLDAAVRAGLALDNARLYAQQRQLAEHLQRSLLTAPPEPDHLHIVVRYEAAAQAAQIGGDWYDAFLQQDGATVLVIGDVVGHDSAAAAAMGQVRGLLRGIAAHTGEGPAAVLQGLDRTMRTLLMETTATAVVTRIEQTLDERRRGVARLRWSNAGHPPPLVVGPDGGVAVLQGLQADLLLGVDPASPRTESTVTLDRGTTVLLYTDGLVERRDQPMEVGLHRLRETVAGLVGLPLDELCDEVLRRLLPTNRDDDVAVVAVRLHRQDCPRPAEAGPRRVPDTVPPVPPDVG